MRTRCYPYFPYSYPYFYTLISLSYPYFYGILCTRYMLVQPIFSCILLNMIGNRQYIVFTSNKVQNFDIFYAYCIHARTCYTIVFQNPAMALYILQQPYINQTHTPQSYNIPIQSPQVQFYTIFFACTLLQLHLLTRMWPVFLCLFAVFSKVAISTTMQVAN